MSYNEKDSKETLSPKSKLIIFDWATPLQKLWSKICGTSKKYTLYIKIGHSIKKTLSFGDYHYTPACRKMYLNAFKDS